MHPSLVKVLLPGLVEMLPLGILPLPVHVPVPGVVVQPLPELTLGHLLSEEEVCDLVVGQLLDQVMVHLRYLELPLPDGLGNPLLHLVSADPPGPVHPPLDVRELPL